MISVKVTPSAPIRNDDIADKIVNGQPGPNMIHKVGSAKQYATKSTGKVCNQAKFPTGAKSGPRKQG